MCHKTGVQIEAGFPCPAPCLVICNPAGDIGGPVGAVRIDPDNNDAAKPVNSIGTTQDKFLVPASWEIFTVVSPPPR
jgi:hypothetical protein